MTTEVDDDPIADDLPGERRAGGPRDQANSLGRGEADQLSNIGL